MSTTTITKTLFLATSAETVWEFLTNKDRLGEWFHRAENNLSDGEEYALIGENDDGSMKRICWGQVKTWAPHRELCYTFTVAPLGGVETEVRWTLEQLDHGTRLVMEHSGIPVAEEAGFGIAMALDKGWDAHFGRLRGCSDN